MTPPRARAEEIVTVHEGDGGWKVYIFGDLWNWYEFKEAALVVARAMRAEMEAALAAAVEEAEARTAEAAVVFFSHEVDGLDVLDSREWIDTILSRARRGPA